MAAGFTIKADTTKVSDPAFEFERHIELNGIRGWLLIPAFGFRKHPLRK